MKEKVLITVKTYPINNREWDPRKLAELEQQKRQLRLFDDQETVARQLEVVRKLPYRVLLSI